MAIVRIFDHYAAVQREGGAEGAPPRLVSFWFDKLATPGGGALPPTFQSVSDAVDAIAANRATGASFTLPNKQGGIVGFRCCTSVGVAGSAVAFSASSPPPPSHPAIYYILSPLGPGAAAFDGARNRFLAPPNHFTLYLKTDLLPVVNSHFTASAADPATGRLSTVHHGNTDLETFELAPMVKRLAIAYEQSLASGVKATMRKDIDVIETHMRSMATAAALTHGGMEGLAIQDVVEQAAAASVAARAGRGGLALRGLAAFFERDPDSSVPIAAHMLRNPEMLILEAEGRGFDHAVYLSDTGVRLGPRWLACDLPPVPDFLESGTDVRDFEAAFEPRFGFLREALGFTTSLDPIDGRPRIVNKHGAVLVDAQFATSEGGVADAAGVAGTAGGSQRRSLLTLFFVTAVAAAACCK